jgi:hypothetical protein
MQQACLLRLLPAVAGCLLCACCQVRRVVLVPRVSSCLCVPCLCPSIAFMDWCPQGMFCFSHVCGCCLARLTQCGPTPTCVWSASSHRPGGLTAPACGAQPGPARRIYAAGSVGACTSQWPWCAWWLTCAEQPAGIAGPRPLQQRAGALPCCAPVCLPAAAASQFTCMRAAAAAVGSAPPLV